MLSQQSLKVDDLLSVSCVSDLLDNVFPFDYPKQSGYLLGMLDHHVRNNPEMTISEFSEYMKEVLTDKIKGV